MRPAPAQGAEGGGRSRAGAAQEERRQRLGEGTWTDLEGRVAGRQVCPQLVAPFLSPRERPEPLLRLLPAPCQVTCCQCECSPAGRGHWRQVRSSCGGHGVPRLRNCAAIDRGPTKRGRAACPGGLAVALARTERVGGPAWRASCWRRDATALSCAAAEGEGGGEGRGRRRGLA